MGTVFSRERVEFRAADRVALVADYYAGGAAGILLLHQRGHDRSSYRDFAQTLQQAGFSVLAPDFRGHGESQGSYDHFRDEDYQKMLLDVVAAAKILDQRGARVAGLVGASIGANTAFRFAGERNVPAVLLSPGLVYHGIDISDVTCRAPVLLVAAQGDEYSASSCRELYENNLFGERRFLLTGGSLHGTYLLAETGPAVLEFLEEHSKMSD